MKVFYAALAMLALAALSVPAVAQMGAPPLPPGAPPNYPVKPGRYTVTVEADPNLPTHTIYRPSDLGRFAGGKLPIVAWGNGACSNAGKLFDGFLKTVASRGYLIVVAGQIGAPLPRFEAPREGAPPPEVKPFETRAAQLTQAIDWALGENGRAGSRYRGKLSQTAIAVMGQSCGGLMALEAAQDARVATAVIFNSGVLPADSPVAKMTTVTKADLAKLHAPLAYFIGGTTDIAYQNAEDDYLRITVPVFKGNLHVGHPGTFWQPGGGWFAEVASRWLDWRLKSDAAAGRLFAGANCGLCRNLAWAVEKKGL